MSDSFLLCKPGIAIDPKFYAKRFDHEELYDSGRNSTGTTEYLDVLLYQSSTPIELVGTYVQGTYGTVNGYNNTLDFKNYGIPGGRDGFLSEGKNVYQVTNPYGTGDRWVGFYLKTDVVKNDQVWFHCYRSSDVQTYTLIKLSVYSQIEQ